MWHVWEVRNARIFRLTAKTSMSVVQQISLVVTTKVLYLGINLPNSIQCHWNIPSNAQVHITRLVVGRVCGWRLSIVPTNQTLIGVMW